MHMYSYVCRFFEMTDLWCSTVDVSVFTAASVVGHAVAFAPISRLFTAHATAHLLTH